MEEGAATITTLSWMGCAIAISSGSENIKDLNSGDWSGGSMKMDSSQEQDDASSALAHELGAVNDAGCDVVDDDSIHCKGIWTRCGIA